MKLFTESQTACSLFRDEVSLLPSSFNTIVLKRLIELVEVVTKNKVKSIEIISNAMDGNTKLMQLYHGIHSGRLKNDQEAFEFLYPEMENRNAYYKLKHVLNERLRNTLFFIDIKKNKFSNIKRAFLECQKMIANFNLLLTKGARDNALYVGEKALRIAEEYEFTQEIIFVSRRLAANYASVSGDRKKYLELSEKVFACKEIFLGETMAEMFYLDLLSLYVKDKSTKTYVADLAGDYLEKLKPYCSKVHSSNFLFYLNMLRTIRYMSVNDYQKAYQITHQALNEIKNHRFLNTRAFGTLSFQNIACCIQLKKHQEGVWIIQELQKIIDTGTFNWYKVQELHFTLSLHTRNYSEAYDIYQNVKQQPNFKNLEANTKETWVIYGAWVHLLKATGKIKCETRCQRNGFRIQKFLNDVPTFARDKRGLNVLILISHIFLLLEQKKYNTILDRFEAVEKYKERYLDREHNLRSNLFIDMLLHVPKCNFRRRKVIRETAGLGAQLKKAKLEISNQSHDLEILPYEDAWGLLLNLL